MLKHVKYLTLELFRVPIQYLVYRLEYQFIKYLLFDYVLYFFVDMLPFSHLFISDQFSQSIQVIILNNAICLLRKICSQNLVLEVIVKHFHQLLMRSDVLLDTFFTESHLARLTIQFEARMLMWG